MSDMMGVVVLPAGAHASNGTGATIGWVLAVRPGGGPDGLETLCLCGDGVWRKLPEGVEICTGPYDPEYGTCQGLCRERQMAHQRGKMPPPPASARVA